MLFKVILLLKQDRLQIQGFLCGGHGSKHTCKDNNKTNKKAIRIAWQNNDFARPSRFFLAVVVQP